MGSENDSAQNGGLGSLPFDPVFFALLFCLSISVPTPYLSLSLSLSLSVCLSLSVSLYLFSSLSVSVSPSLSIFFLCLSICLSSSLSFSLSLSLPLSVSHQTLSATPEPLSKTTERLNTLVTTAKEIKRSHSYNVYDAAVRTRARNSRLVTFLVIYYTMYIIHYITYIYIIHYTTYINIIQYTLYNVYGFHLIVYVI